MTEHPPSPLARLVARVAGSLWLGAGAFILITASAVFAAAGSPAIAANVVGAMLSRWYPIAIIAPVILLLLGWRRARRFILALLFAALLLATVQTMVDARIRRFRNESLVPISSLARTDPLRRHFGMLHGVSSLLLVMQVIAAASFVAMDRER